MPKFETFDLMVDGSGIVSWTAPDGNTYKLDPRKAEIGTPYFVKNSEGKAVMSLFKKSGENARLEVTLEGSPSTAASLIHYDDDTPHQYYYATDGGNAANLKCQAFILYGVDRQDCPIVAFAGFKVLVVN